KALGLPILALPELAVVHWGTPQSLAAFFRKQRWHGRSVLRVFLSDVSQRRNMKPVLFALYTAACLAAVVPVAAVCVYARIAAPLLVLMATLALPSALMAARQAARISAK